MVHSQTLTIMFTDIAGFTARTSTQSRAENAAMLRAHDDLLVPIVQHFGGRRIKSIGDALLCVFTSPTDALRCGMAMQDALAEHNRSRTSEEALHVRVALNQGEVRLERGDIFGEPVNIAARVEGITPASEVYFTESVYLAMTKAEVPSERVGIHELKGIPEPVTVFRVVPHGGADPSLPFGGMHRGIQRPRQTLERVRTFVSRAPRQWTVRAAAGVAVALVLLWTVPRLLSSPRTEAEKLIESGRLVEAEAVAQRILLADSDDAVGLLISGHVAFARKDRKTGVKQYELALAEDSSLRADPRLVRNLVEALESVGKPAQDVLSAYPAPGIVDALTQRSRQPGYWGRRRAVEALTQIGEGGEVDQEAIALADLKEAPDCAQRLAAVKVVREHKTKAALPQLKQLADPGFVNHFKNGCLIDEAAQTVKAIEND